MADRAHAECGVGDRVTYLQPSTDNMSGGLRRCAPVCLVRRGLARSSPGDPQPRFRLSRRDHYLWREGPDPYWKIRTETAGYNCRSLWAARPRETNRPPCFHYAGLP